MSIGHLALYFLTSSSLWNLVVLWDTQFMTNILMAMMKPIQTQEVIWFISQSIPTKDNENIQDFINKIHQKSSITQMVITNNTELRVIRTASKRNYMGIVLTTGPEDSIMMVHDKVLRGRHYYINFVILVSLTDDFRIMEKVLWDLNLRNFINTFVYIGYTNGSSDLFGIKFYPEYSIENRTDIMGYFRKMMAFIYGGINYLGYKLHMPLRRDVPNVFKYYNRNGLWELRGISFGILNFYMKYTNLTVADVQMPPDALGGEVVNMKAALDLVRSRKVQILSHSYALFAIDEKVDKSYPLMVVKWCLMVPIWNSVTEFYYPLEPFTILVWYCLIIAFLLLSLTDFLWQLTSSLSRDNQPQSIIWILINSILEHFCYIINTSSGRRISNPSILRCLFYALVWFHGFILTANYTSLLGSILTVTLFRNQIDTMEDLIKANVSVMIIDYEYDFLMSGGLDLSEQFLKLIKRVDPATFMQHQLALNKTYAYFVTDDRWHFLQIQQRNLRQGLFKFTDICFGSYHLAFPMVPDSPIWRDMEYFLYRVHSSGMLQYYESVTFGNALRMGLVQRFTEATEYQSAHMEHVLMVFGLMLTMYGLSCMVLFMELWWHWMSSRERIDALE